MIIPLACVNEHISVGSSRQAPVYTLNVRLRLPAVRVSCVLAAPERRIGSARSGYRSSDVSSWWSSSGVVAKKLATVWSSVVETQRVWSQTSYQTLQRVGTTILRSASLDKLINAAAVADHPAAEEDEEEQPLPPTALQYQASLSRFVTPATRNEVDQACMLADLSDMSYDVARIHEQDLEQRHSLRLVKRSIQPGAKAPAAVPASTSMQAADPSLAAAAAADQDMQATALLSPRSPRVSAFTVYPVEDDEVEVMDADEVAAADAVRSPSSDQATMRSAAEALSAVAAAALGRMASADADAVSSSLSASAGAALSSTSSREQQQQLQEEDAPEAPIHPADWFVCDSQDAEEGATRYFIFQGSISLEHWKINLTFDPVPFDNLGGRFKVHRGVYLAALQMYDTLVPLVQEHLAQGPHTRVAFAGHSLGGSLATVLMLLMVHRGVLPAEQVATVHTFGAPAVFCEGATGAAPSGGPCGACMLPCDHKAAAMAAFAAGAGLSASSLADAGNAAQAAAPQQPQQLEGLLEQLGLRREVVRNVIMTRDIVPRAFVCDYSSVADVLKSWMPSFKEHVGLAPCKPHKVLYNFLGNVEVLHPPLSSGFVLPDEGHFMLPPEAALYKLEDPQHRRQQQLLLPKRCSSPSGCPSGTGEAAALSLADQGAADLEVVSPDPLGLTLGDAILAFMNSPHPLETLGEWRSYGPDGTISRFHNPANYTRALVSLRELAAH